MLTIKNFLVKYRIRLFFSLLPFLFSGSAFAQDGPSTWIELEFSKKIVKNLKAEINPELRLFNGFEMDSYIFEGGLSYKAHKYLSLGSYYRYENEYKYKNSTGAYKGQEASNRWAFDAKSGFELSRFDFSFRIRYTNGDDYDETTNDHASYFRYRGKVGYNIKGCKIDPYVLTEIIHDLIYKEINRTRYTAGLTYPINKHHEVGMFYRLQDYYETKDKPGEQKQSMNIIGIGYSLRY
jgi:long-subunit fatty acid transport protein